MAQSVYGALSLARTRPQRSIHIPAFRSPQRPSRPLREIPPETRRSSSSSSQHPITHPPRLLDRTALITGSSSGLGREIALLFASHGAKHVLCADLHNEPREGGANPEDVKPTHELINEIYNVGGSAGSKADFVKCDVTRVEDVEGAVSRAVAAGGRLDIIVNNAGLGEPTGSPRIHAVPTSTFDHILTVNLRGVFLGCKHACAQFLRQDLHPTTARRGHIVNVSSMLGYVGISGGTVAYCASKGGVLNLTRQVALDYAKDKVHVNALCPGFTRTAMTKANFESEAVSAEMVRMTPWGEWGHARDVARAAVALASEDASWITGVGLPVDGGYLAQ